MPIKTRIKSFTDLFAWQEGHKLVLMVYSVRTRYITRSTARYKITDDFPKKELFGLTSQMRRAVVSVTSNIAEGFGRRSIHEKYQFYNIAHGSLIELQNQLLIARDVGYIGGGYFDEIAAQSVVVSKLIYGLKKIKNG